MNRTKFKVFLPLLLICAIALTALTASSFSSTEMDGLDAQLLTGAVAAETERLKIGVIPLEALAQQMRSRQSISDSLDSHTGWRIPKFRAILRQRPRRKVCKYAVKY